MASVNPEELPDFDDAADAASITQSFNGDANDPLELVRQVVGGRKPLSAYEKALVMRNAEAAQMYAYLVMHGQRWTEAEPAIMRDPVTAFWYARGVIQGRWPEAEPSIVTHPESAGAYAAEFMNGKWPEAEARAAADPAYNEVYQDYVTPYTGAAEESLLPTVASVASKAATLRENLIVPVLHEHGCFVLGKPCRKLPESAVGAIVSADTASIHEVCLAQAERLQSRFKLYTVSADLSIAESCFAPVEHIKVEPLFESAHAALIAEQA